MNTLDYIKQRFAFIGTITDEGASVFALDFGLEFKEYIGEDEMKAIAGAVDSFVDKSILHPTSVNENGFSVSWSADAAKAFVKLALRKYGIEPNGDTSALVGLSVIKDASNLW